MQSTSITRRVSMLAVIGLLPAALAAGAANEQIAMQKEGLDLIRQVEEVARDVRYHAGRLNSFNSTLLVTKAIHKHHLAGIRTLMNQDLAPALGRLNEIRRHLPDWKQQSIERMLKTAQALAKGTHMAILEKNEPGAPPPAMNQDYKRLVAMMYRHADNLVRTSDAAGTYAAARLKAAEAGIPVPKS